MGFEALCGNNGFSSARNAPLGGCHKALQLGQSVPGTGGLVCQTSKILQKNIWKARLWLPQVQIQDTRGGCGMQGCVFVSVRVHMFISRAGQGH